MTPSKAEVAVVGLGFVGLTFAVSLASKGFRVVGIEQSEEVLRSLKLGKPHFHEAGLEVALREQLDASRIDLAPSMEFAWSCSSPRVVVLTLGTPRGLAGADSGPLHRVMEAMRVLLVGGELVILRSTVSVGTTRALGKSLMDSGLDVHLAMCPERTVEGQALRELSTLPQIVGGIDPPSSSMAARFFAQQGVPVVTVSSPEVAELSKLASNTYRDLQFAFANELASVARAAGVDPYELVESTNWEYPRSHLALPGPVGGPCLQKDPWILAESAESLGVDARISRAARITNELVPADVAAQVLRLIERDDPTAKVAIFGLAFKGRPETDDLRGSPSLEVINLLTKERPDASISVWDPLIASLEVDATAGNCYLAASHRECMLGADAVVVMTNHAFFSTPEFLEALDQLPPNVPVLDLWPTFNTQAGRGQLRFGAT